MPSSRISASRMLGAPSSPLLDGTTPAVYGLVFPETRAITARLWEEQPHALFERAWEDRQDAAHGIFLDSWIEWCATRVRGLGALAHRYVTNGSSEAIRESIWMLGRDAAEARKTPVMHTFAGEYEGYVHYARAAGIEVVAHQRERWRESLDFGADALHRWYLSQPSAIDGSVFADFAELLRALAARSVGVAVDLAYVGATTDRLAIDLASPSVTHVFFSLSKVFGLFYHRVGGVLSRAPMPGLDGNKWFKNTFSLALGSALMDAFPEPELLPSRYRDAQIEACRRLSERHELVLTPSDVLLLATMPGEPGDERLAPFLRGARYRFCLTPMLDHLIRGAFA